MKLRRKKSLWMTKALGSAYRTHADINESNEKLRKTALKDRGSTVTDLLSSWSTTAEPKDQFMQRCPKTVHHVAGYRRLLER